MASPSVWLTTLGCSKNQVDSDKISAVLGDAGYIDAESPDAADVVMVNTCAFIEAADLAVHLDQGRPRPLGVVVHP